MNFYKHHIGDYDADTAHLTWLEDAAYRRLISLYYRREAPIPSDIMEACRLVRAAGKPERDAVESVLREFFALEGDGWHNKRCDSEIAAFAADEPAREAKRENAQARQQRARERRKRLFEELRSRGVVVAYGTPTKELVTLPSRVTGDAASHDSHAAVTRDERDELRLPEPEYSERLRLSGADAPSGGGNGKPPDLAAELFSLGLRAFAHANVPDKDARSLIGKARKTLGLEGALALMGNLLAARPPISDPVAYVSAALRPKPGNGVVL